MARITRANVKLYGRMAKIVTLANAVEITDTNSHIYRLVQEGGMTGEEIRQYSHFRIHVNDTHDQNTDTFKIYTQNIAVGSTIASGAAIYNNSTELSGGSPRRRVFQAKAGGTGADANYVVIPCLENLVASDLALEIRFGVAPTAGGALTLKVEMS